MTTNNKLTWDEIRQYRDRIELAESITLPRDQFIRILDFMEEQDQVRQIIGGHNADLRKALKKYETE